MPSRTVTLAIVAFWLLTAGWFVSRELAPLWRADEAPPYTIDVADEAMPRVVAPVKWECTLNDRPVGRVSTTLTYRAHDDTFELSATCPKLSLPVGPVTILAENYDDRVRVTRDGELRAMQTAADLSVRGVGPTLSGRFELAAEVRNGRLERQIRFKVPELGTYSPPLPPGDPPIGRVLNAMHPVPRVSGLRPGQTWRQPLADPRTDILRVVYEQAGLDKFVPLPRPPAALTATVLSEPQPLKRNTSTRRCLVIEYRGDDDYVARTWVAVADGDVLRQEAGWHGEMLVLQRE
jgi:hypothetical protein